jgi:hypothetical protein
MPSSGHVRLVRVIREQYATSRKVVGSIPDEVIGFLSVYLILLALRSTQNLPEMSTRNLPWGKGRPTRKAHNLTAVCEPTV